VRVRRLARSWGTLPSGWYERQRGATLAQRSLAPNRRGDDQLIVLRQFGGGRRRAANRLSGLRRLRRKRRHAGDRERRCLPSRTRPAAFSARPHLTTPSRPSGPPECAATESRDERVSTPPRSREGTGFPERRRGVRPGGEALRATTPATFRPGRNLAPSSRPTMHAASMWSPLRGLFFRPDVEASSQIVQSPRDTR
jgi:hypothetical protein